MTLDPGHVVPDDVRPLARLGISRQAVEDALAVAYCFNIITRLADAFGWNIESDAGYRASARMLLGKGYLMPFRGKRQAAPAAAAR